MYRILLLDTTKSGNASTYKYQLDDKGAIKEYVSLSDLDAAVESLLEVMPKNGVVPVDVLGYSIDAKFSV